MTSTAPRPLFIYGTLCAKPLLAWAMTGSAENVSQVEPLLQPAKVVGYKRVAVLGCDYPAVIQDEKSVVEGYFLRPRTTSERKKLDDFEGEVYKPVVVAVEIQTASTLEHATADMYVWDSDMDKLSAEPWDLQEFIKTRLDDWIDLFDGMEMVGDDE
ncbi:aig2 family protein [Ophiostoma piceae UAMH 11346]|uniref:Putative gamma-glutamylcyclotransferase n=1 Tax=Ophiostoma piceae (strain UAMH 11346) TaxID=1262450 RepID=S3BYL3_OPHP1|nr:aig2 family protein [Ophiostoma piceae UAMH 11346]